MENAVVDRGLVMTISLHYFRSNPPNFGDELNTLIWRALLPELDDTDRDGVLVGIGTILDWHIPKERDVFVLGAGAGLAPLPPDLLTSRYHVAAVRGPLTAKLAGLPPASAVADPALLLRAVYPQLMSSPRRATGKPILVPHFTTSKDPGWRRACALAGIEFVDPTGNCLSILKKIVSARLVIAEAMHAAIVADAFRIPWTPVASTRHFSTFKWVDWALSLQVPFRPTVLPAVSVRHKCQRLWLSLFAEQCFERVSTEGGAGALRSEAVSALLSNTAAKLKGRESPAALWLRLRAATVHNRVLDPLVARLGPSLRPIDARMERRVSRVLSELAAKPGYLSSNEVCAARLQTLVERTEWLRNQIAGTRERHIRTLRPKQSV